MPLFRSKIKKNVLLVNQKNNKLKNNFNTNFNMNFLLFVIYVLSKQNKLIKYNNKYIFMEKILILGDKKQEFNIENNLIKLSNGKYLCTDEKKVVECKNKPSKWDVAVVGNIYKIIY
ncbi:hypothetical protein NAPIS_ORF00311 [Vairimorpha apis BRL 01]|uniref:Uncharacterized protein n=1 Tax=Vairimorpha apis BRL 01 TaxID=1037528 RepID=T0LCS5_9MICR|nr:hypothetical protein NAPIS_ORF00311 [Vairimorpha apis BRL 01]